MYLSSIEIQGFKTFAKKTTIPFPKGSNEKNTLSVIVGPNGSGKSNLADAIRWCLGEQSMKQLRGKKTQDIIFSGSKGHGRSGFAEVKLSINNEDGALGVDYKEVAITRRLHRDGESDYELNGKKVRLTDIQLLLAEAGIGQRSYTVIGQGMIDHVLTASPEERKIFFDDATGVRGLQLKRHQAMNRLKRSTEHLVEIEMLVAEIEPRLRILKRQVKRLEEREKVESELREIQSLYFGNMWWQLSEGLQKSQNLRSDIAKQIQEKKTELKKGDEELSELERQYKENKSGENEELIKAQKYYRDLQQQLSKAKQKQFDAERTLELDRVRAQSNWAPLPLTEIIGELEALHGEHESHVARLRSAKQMEDVHAIADDIEKTFSKSKKLKTRLTKPNPEDFKADPAAIKSIDDAKKEVASIQKNISAAEKEIDKASKQKDSQDKSAFFDLQRSLRKIQNDLHALEQTESQHKIESARLETKLEGIEREVREDNPKLLDEIKKQRPEQPLKNAEQTRETMHRLHRKLELIGGIDEETIGDFHETKERFEFLSTQMTDLQQAISSTEKVIDELDTRIQKDGEKAFKKINEEFQKYFKVLFGGGSCSLIKLKKSDGDQEQKVALDRALESLADQEVQEIENDSIAAAALKRFKKRREHIAGIEIQATPPGKKLKSLNLLSGGERALTSIALLSAIMATNPSPFVILDEVDAALDEANTVRFANILEELQKLTQFIVITHNRATMERADLLYGVTMGDDGVSNLLSVNLTDIEEAGSARR